MDKEQKRLWRELVAVWNNDAVACHLYLARLYTQRYPQDMYGWVVLGSVLSAVASYEEATRALRTARRLCPKERLDFVYSQVGRYYREQGDHRRAERWFRKAVRENETGSHVVILGACLAKQGKYGEAKRWHRRAIKMGSEVVDEAYLNLGLILRAEGKYKKALECFERALEIDPKYTLAKQARKDIVRLFKIRRRI